MYDKTLFTPTETCNSLNQIVMILSDLKEIYIHLFFFLNFQFGVGFAVHQVRKKPKLKSSRLIITFSPIYIGLK